MSNSTPDAVRPVEIICPAWCDKTAPHTSNFDAESQRFELNHTSKPRGPEEVAVVWLERTDALSLHELVEGPLELRIEVESGKLTADQASKLADELVAGARYLNGGQR